MTLEELTRIVAGELETSARSASLESSNATAYWSRLAHNVIIKLAGSTTNEHTAQTIADYLRNGLALSRSVERLTNLSFEYPNFADNPLPQRSKASTAKRPPPRRKRRGKNT